MYSMLAPNGWTCRKVEMIPEERKIISHAKLLTSSFTQPLNIDKLPEDVRSFFSLHSLPSPWAQWRSGFKRLLPRVPLLLKASCMLSLQIRKRV